MVLDSQPADRSKPLLDVRCIGRRAGFSPTLALVVLCMAAAASILPFTAGGAVVAIGATAGVLVLLGVPHQTAVNFSLGSSLLLTTTALTAGVLGATASLMIPSGARRIVAPSAA